MSVLSETYELTFGDLYTVSITWVDLRGKPAELEIRLIRALESTEVTNYSPELIERVKSLLNEHYEHISDITMIMEPHPIWPDMKQMYVRVGKSTAFAYFLSPKVQ